MGDRKTYIIKQIVKYSQKLDQKGFGANHDGNISAKFANNILATPTAVSKSDIVDEIVITLDETGKQIGGVGKPFSEIKLHLAAYAARPEVRAVVHAHPPFATARGLLGKPLYPVLPEAVVSLGNIIPVVDFAMPGDSSNDMIITQALSIADVFMLPGNGVFAVGDNVEQAYLRLELVEHLSKIYYYAESAGAPMDLSSENMTQLLAKRASLGLGPQSASSNAAAVEKFSAKNVAFSASPPGIVRANKDEEIKGQAIDVIKTLIADEIKKIVSE